MQKYSNSVQDTAGNAIEAASVYVYDQGTTNLSTIYSDNGSTVTTNPQTTNSLGEFSFYAADGRYDIKVSKTGITTQNLLDIILYDPAASSGSAGVGFLQSGIGAVAGTVQGELRRNALTPYQFGAVGDGTTDDQTALAACFAAAAAASPARAVYIPAATFKHSNTLTAAGIQVYGEGDASVLAASAPDTMAVILTGTGPSLRNVKITATTTTRNANNNADGVYVNGANRFTVDNVRIVGANGVGIFCTGASKGRITNNRVESTLADGIHMTGVSSEIIVSNNEILSGGDDSIAIVGYQSNGAQCTDIVIAGNVINGGGARGISVLGALRVQVENNKVFGGSAAAGFAIIVGYDGTYLTYGCTDVSVIGNQVKQASLSSSNAVITVVGNGTQTSSNIDISNNIIDSATAGRGINIVGAGTPGISNLRIAGNIIKSTTIGVEIDFTSDVSISGNIIDTTSTYGIVTGTSCSGVIQIVGNTFRTLNTSAGGSIDAVVIDNAASVTDILAVGNYYGGENAINWGIENAATSARLKEYCNTLLGFTSGQIRTGTVARSVKERYQSVSADNGDAAKTLVPYTNEEVQLWNTTLTAARAVTLSTGTNIYPGAKFRIVRGSGATGAFNLNVGTGPLKALGSASTWCDVEFNGTAWVLTASGSL